MDYHTLGALIALAFVASYIQSVAGFAMGMIMMALAGGLEWVSIGLLAATISLLSLVNVGIALRHHWRLIERRLIMPLAMGQLPAIVGGVWLLYLLSDSAVSVLKLLLGVFIALGSLSLAVRPRQLPRVSSAGACFAVGTLGGLVGGLFSASGPVLGWFSYRQPLSFETIRATLLACFAMTTATRTVVVGVRGELTEEVMVLFAILLPTVAAGSWLGARFKPPMSEELLKRGAFGLLFVLGLWICADALVRIWS
ncbi:MAG: sulfite exporter TauE/SafE family protein [Pseudomonadales bacterium]